LAALPGSSLVNLMGTAVLVPWSFIARSSLAVVHTT
jgi:hypothetical protein